MRGGSKPQSTNIMKLSSTNYIRRAMNASTKNNGTVRENNGKWITILILQQTKKRHKLQMEINYYFNEPRNSQGQL